MGKLWRSVKKILGALTDVLVKGREAGLWAKQASPQPLLSMPTVEGKVSNGMPHWLAGVWATACFLAATAAQGLHWSVLLPLILSNPKAGLSQLSASFLTAFVAAWGAYLQTPGQASVHLGPSSALREAAETTAGVTINVPLDPTGGKITQ